MISDRQTQRADFAVSVLLILLSGIGILIWNSFNPAGMDDYYFRTVMEDSDEERFSWCFGRKIESFCDALYSAWHVFLYDLGRWPNVTHVLFRPFPDIVERIFSGIVLTADIYLLSAIASGSRCPKALVTVLVTAGVWIALPWYDNFYSLNFQANYIWPTAVLAVYMLLLPKALHTGGIKRLPFLLLCVFLGEGHEAFAICAGAYTAGLLPSVPKADRRRYITAIIFIFIGFCINLWAGTWHRFFDIKLGKEPFAASLPFLVTRMVSGSWPLWTALLLFIIRLFAAKHDRRKLLLTENLPYIAAIAANMVIVLAVKGLGRTSWPGILMAILLVVGLIRPFIDKTKPVVAAVVSLAFACLYSLWFVQLIKWQKLIYEENAVLTANVERLGPSPTQVYPGPYTPTDDIPFYLLGIVNNPIDETATRRSLAASVKPQVNAPMIVAVTPAMEGPYGEWPLVAGNASVRGVWPMIATVDSTSTRLRVTFGTDTRRLSPLNRLISRIKGDSESGPVLDLAFRRDTVALPDRTRVFAIMPEPLPRTVKGRDVLRIDTIPLR